MDSYGSQLNIGDRITVRGIGAIKKTNFNSQILDIIDYNNFIISGPIHKSHIIPVRLDSTFEIIYFKEDKGRFSFKAVVTDRDVNGIYKLKIRKVDETIKVQERDFYRLPININVLKTLSTLDGLEEKKIEENCVTKDISGGGMKLLCNYTHSIKDVVDLKLNINESDIYTDGIVVRIKKSDSFGYIYEIGIKFTNLKTADRDNIIRFIFEQQRKKRRKELI